MENYIESQQHWEDNINTRYEENKRINKEQVDNRVQDDNREQPLPHKFKVGQKVVYDGLIATIESLGIYFDGELNYSIISEENSELTCTAREEKCELYNGEELDQTERLFQADSDSLRIQHVARS